MSASDLGPPPELLRGQPYILLENMAEIMWIVVSALVGYFRTFEIGCTQQFFGPLDSDSDQIIFEGFSDFAAKDHAEMTRAKIYPVGNVVQH